MPDASSSYDRRSVWAWAFYDFANSAFNTLVVTFVYATYFTKEIAPNDEIGTTLWGNAAAFSAVLIAVLSPVLGTLADSAGMRKRFLAIATGVSVLATAALFFPRSGDVWIALTLFVTANTAFELAFVFYNAYLPELAPEAMMGRISGWGWALGYMGGLLALALGYTLLIAPDTPPFGLSLKTGANIRAANMLVAAWFLLFSLPLFAFAPAQKKRPTAHFGRAFRRSFHQLAETAREIRRFRQVVRLLAARFFYNDGLLTIFNFGSIYAANVLGFSFNEIFLFGIVLNVAAGLGAFAFGSVDDRIGGTRTLLITIGGLMIGTGLALAAQTKVMLWIAGVIIGAFIGPNQSASRSLLGRFTPADKKGEFFGFFAFSGKATAFLGPLLFGGATFLFGTQRAGVASVLLFFVAGGALLLMVDEQEGKRQAQPDADSSTPA